MSIEQEATSLAEAVRHCRAGLKALEAAHQSARDRGEIYPTHIYVAAAELAHAIETAIAVALRAG